VGDHLANALELPAAAHGDVTRRLGRAPRPGSDSDPPSHGAPDGEPRQGDPARPAPGLHPRRVPDFVESFRRANAQDERGEGWKRSQHGNETEAGQDLDSRERVAIGSRQQATALARLVRGWGRAQVAPAARADGDRGLVLKAAPRAATETAEFVGAIADALGARPEC